LERRADEINLILKTFGHYQNQGVNDYTAPLQQHHHQPRSSTDEDHLIDSLCDLPVQMHPTSETSKMHLDLFRPKIGTAQEHHTLIGKEDERSCEQDGPLQKYESPKFFVGSGSPVQSKRKQSHAKNEQKPNASAQAKQASTTKAEVEQHFSF